LLDGFHAGFVVIGVAAVLGAVAAAVSFDRRVATLTVEEEVSSGAGAMPHTRAPTPAEE
jgi:hypothetical protein